MLASQWIGIVPDERMLKSDGLGSQLVEDVIDFLRFSSVSVQEFFTKRTIVITSQFPRFLPEILGSLKDRHCFRVGFKTFTKILHCFNSKTGLCHRKKLFSISRKLVLQRRFLYFSDRNELLHRLAVQSIPNGRNTHQADDDNRSQRHRKNQKEDFETDGSSSFHFRLIGWE